VASALLMVGQIGMGGGAATVFGPGPQLMVLGGDASC